MSQWNSEARHPATPARIARARVEGQSYKSQHLAVTLQMACGLGCLVLSASTVGQGLINWTRHYWGSAVLRADQMPMAAEPLWELAAGVGGPLLLSLLALWLAGWLSWLLQVGWMLGKQPLVSASAPNLARPLAGVWSPDRLAGSALGMAQFGLAFAVFIGLGVGRYHDLVALWQCAPEDWGDVLLQTLSSQIAPLLVVMLAVSIIDFLFQRWMFYRRLAMTDEELREEQKGDAVSSQLRGRLRAQHSQNSGKSKRIEE